MELTNKFTGKATIYSKYRSSYPMEYIDYLINRNGLTNNHTLADIGSGTGILTNCPAFMGFSGGIEETPEVFQQFFRNGTYEFTEFENHLEYDLNGFIGRNLSSSYAPKRD